MGPSQVASDTGRAAGSLLIGVVQTSPGRFVPITSRARVPARVRCSHPAGACTRHPGPVWVTLPCSSAKAPVPEITQVTPANS